MDLISCMRTWPSVYSETALIIFAPDCLHIISCTCSILKVTVMGPKAAKTPAKISSLHDVLTCFWKYFENDWAGPTHLALWTPAPVLLPKEDLLSLFSETGVVVGGTHEGYWDRFGDGIFWNWAVPKEFSQQGNIVEETSHLLLKKWAKLINRGINAVKKDVLSLSLSK